MSERIQLKLTRNRLFEFDNCVLFGGKLSKQIDLTELKKALKTLFLKEPILTGKIELNENSEAFLVTENAEPEFEIYNGDTDEIISEIRRKGLDFFKRVFRFALINGDTVCIFAHTAVADVRSLMFLFSELFGFYNKSDLMIIPSEIKLFSSVYDLPSNVFSPLTDKLASDLEVGWQKKIARFTVEDFLEARNKYFSSASEVGKTGFVINESHTSALKEFAADKGIDVSSAVAFVLFEKSKDFAKSRKEKRMVVQANERVFFDSFANMAVGPFNGSVKISQKKKNAKLPLNEQVVAFHKELYKKVTSSFSVYYNESLLMKLSPSFCDSAYMYTAGLFKHKYSKKLAENYGFKDEGLTEFCAYNLSQEYWSALPGFSKLYLSEPLKQRTESLLTFTEYNGKLFVDFEYKKDVFGDSDAASLCDAVKDGILSFCK